MDLKEVVIDAQRTLGRDVMLVDVIPAYEYKDGRRTDKVTGFRYVVTMPSHAFEKINVRIDGEKRMEKPVDYAKVVFDGLEMHLYRGQDGWNVSATAKGIHPIKAGA